MYKDEIIAEVWRIRDEYAKKHHHDTREILNDLQERQRSSANTFVDRRSALAHPSPNLQAVKTETTIRKSL